MNEKDKKTLVCLVGATASGKTALAIKLAQIVNTEIISADSRQFYKELSIGTAKPTQQELSAAPHHFINNKSITETYSAGDFEIDAIQKIDELFKIHDTVILTGGSGMYIDAVCKGFDPLPKVEEKVRSQLINEYHQKGLKFLQDELKKLDPEYFAICDTQNPQRIMRALEVVYATGKPFSTFHKKQAKPRNFNIISIGIDWERNDLYRRIDTRVDAMIKAGLEAEAKQYEAYRNHYALRTVGYSEFFDYFDGKESLPNTINLIKQHTRNFAKRQITWFKRNLETKWFDARNENAIFAALNKLN